MSAEGDARKNGAKKDDLFWGRPPADHPPGVETSYFRRLQREVDRRIKEGTLLEGDERPKPKGSGKPKIRKRLLPD